MTDLRLQNHRCHISPTHRATSFSVLDKVLRSHLWWPEGGGWREASGAGVAALSMVSPLKQEHHCAPAKSRAATPTAPCWREELQCRVEFQGQIPAQGMSQLPQCNSPVQPLLPKKLGSPTSKDELQCSLNVPSSGLQGSET